MKIAEVLLLEAYFDELELAVKDRFAQFLGSDVNEIPTEEFRKSLALDGFPLSFEELNPTRTNGCSKCYRQRFYHTKKGKIQ